MFAVWMQIQHEFLCCILGCPPACCRDVACRACHVSRMFSFGFPTISRAHLMGKSTAFLFGKLMKLYCIILPWYEHVCNYILETKLQVKFNLDHICKGCQAAAIIDVAIWTPGVYGSVYAYEIIQNHAFLGFFEFSIPSTSYSLLISIKNI